MADVSSQAEGLGRVWSGVFQGGLLAIPVSLILSLIASTAGMRSDSPLGWLFRGISRIPTTLGTFLLGMILIQQGWEEDGSLWGFVAMVSTVPVICRTSANAVFELPRGIFESAVGLGMSRMGVLRVVGGPILLPVFAGSIILGLGRALFEGWMIHEFRTAFGSWPSWSDAWGLIGSVAILSLLGSLLLEDGRKRSKNIKERFS